MSEHVLYCLDHPAAADRSEADHLSGWLLCSRPVAEVEARVAGGPALSSAYGLARPDVARAYGSYPGADRSGFRLDFPAGTLAPDDDVELALTVKGRLGRRRRYDLLMWPAIGHVHAVKLAGGRRHFGFSPQTLEDDLRASLTARPGLTFRLDIINKCNLRCVMCWYNDPEFRKRPAVKLTLDDFRGLFAGIAPWVRNVVLSCADEPLASRHFPEILAYLVDEHPHLDIELCTNATLMHAGIRRLLVEKSVAHLMFSMDGVRRETLERIRVGAEYDRIAGNILALRDLKRRAGARYPIFIFNFVMMDDNVHEAPAFVELAARLGAELIDFRHVVPGYFDEPDRMLESHPAKYDHFRRRILAEAKRHGVAVVLPPPFDNGGAFDPASAPEADLGDFESVAPDPDDGGPVPVPRKFPRGFRARHARGTAAETFARTFCERPFSEIMIAEQELVRPCAWYQGHLGRLGTGKTLAEIFFDDGFRRLRRNMLEPNGDPGCRSCPLKAEYLVSGTDRPGPSGRRWRARLKRSRLLDP